ncbi:hypothetical protein E6H33_09510 [Candidatus Bathyarchaeota archaeon]|nr:MAG: hypothetical protein E6H33_09510 [Candidatus Bathyarchaeota archaeon]
MQLRTLRLGIALTLALLIFIFFVPLVPYRTQAVCSSSFSCPLTPVSGFYTGYNSLGLLFFHWGASLGTSFGDATYTPPIVMTTLGGSPGGSPSQLTAFGVSLFILLPIALLIATLLSPEEWRILSAGFSYLQRLRHHSETNPEDQR